MKARVHHQRPSANVLQANKGVRVDDRKLPNCEAFVAQTGKGIQNSVRGVREQQVVGVGFEPKPIWQVFNAILT